MDIENVLLQTEEYSSKYVALKSFEDSTVVAHGTIPKEVMEEASSKGYPEAVIVFVPENDMAHVYHRLVMPCP
jgi:hypothetical protein